MDRQADNLVERMQSAAKLSAEDARHLAIEMCNDGIRSAPEAEAVLDFNARLPQDDPDWASQFIRAMRDYLLLRTEPEGNLSDADLDWLSDILAPEGLVRTGRELDLLILLQKQADSLPARFGLFALHCACERLVNTVAVTAEEVGRIRQILLGSAPEAAPWISREEAKILFQTNDLLGGSPLDPSWSRLFARTIGNHLVAQAHPFPSRERLGLARENWIAQEDTRPGQMVGCLSLGFMTGGWFETMCESADKAALARQMAHEASGMGQQMTDKRGWLRRRLGWDGLNVSERAMVDFLNLEAPGLTTGLVVAAS